MLAADLAAFLVSTVTGTDPCAGTPSSLTGPSNFEQFTYAGVKIGFTFTVADANYGIEWRRNGGSGGSGELLPGTEYWETGFTSGTFQFRHYFDYGDCGIVYSNWEDAAA